MKSCTKIDEPKANYQNTLKIRQFLLPEVDSTWQDELIGCINNLENEFWEFIKNLFFLQTLFSLDLAVFWSVKTCSYFNDDSFRSVNQDVSFSDIAIVDDGSAPD
jgi:hypothetical protein